MADQTQPSTSDRPSEVDGLDAAVEADINPEPTQPDAMNVDGSNDAGAAARNGAEDPAPAQLEARIPAKKDTTLREFLGKMDDYAPIVSWTLFPRQFSYLLFTTDSRRSHKLLPDPRRASTSASNQPTARPTVGARHSEVRCRYRR